MKRTLAILTTFLIAWCPLAFPQGAQKIPTEVYKCNDGGKAVYQDGLCSSGPNKPLKTRDAKGIEAPKGRAAAAQEPPPGPAPVAIIPYTPSKPLGNSQMSRNVTPSRSANGAGQ
jgi:hypothetical protein